MTRLFANRLRLFANRLCDAKSLRAAHGSQVAGASCPALSVFCRTLGMLTMFALSLAGNAVGALEVGDIAPDFELPGSDGNVYRLSDFRDKQHVIVAWFPQAFTSGCTLECKSLADSGEELRRFDVSYFMVSVDPLAENTAFAAANAADFPLLSDESTEVAQAYGVLYQNRFALRYTIYIDKSGIVTEIDSNVNPATSANDMIETLERLQVPLR